MEFDSFGTLMDCCGNINVTETDEKEIRFWDIIYSEINQNFDNIVGKDLFGKKDYCLAQNIMDIHHLLKYLQLIQKEREFDALNSETGKDKGSTYYIREYCTKKIREVFQCKGYSIQNILQIFQLFNLAIEFAPLNEEDPPEYYDGIGYMQIEGTTDPIFRIS
jgi:hypothetical protein